MDGSTGTNTANGEQSIETEYWAYALLDTSRMSTCCVAILLIVYGSFRSLKLERDALRLQKEKSQIDAAGGAVRTLDSTQALLLPVGASVSLLIMFFFFDSLQTIFALCTAVVATVAFAFLLLPLCQYLLDPCTDGTTAPKISLGLCGRYTYAECASAALALTLVALWVCTGHWLLMDALGMGLCVAFMALVRLPSLKVSTVLLAGLLLYDVFWVFFSSYIFNANVMVRVATRPADNPVGIVARKLHLVGLGGMLRDPPKLSLPGKLVFPSTHTPAKFSMLGLGDIVMPGLLLCFVLRYDAHKRAQALNNLTANAAELGAAAGAAGGPPADKADGGEAALSRSVSTTNLLVLRRVTYFHCSLIGYFLGLVTATVVSEVFKAAQPALLYLVPFTLLPLLLMAYMKGDLARMWHEPFMYVPQAKFQTI